MRRHNRVLLIVGITAFACLSAWVLRTEAQEPVPSTQEEAAKTKSVRRPAKLKGRVFMGAKLTASEQALKGLLTRDFDQIGDAAAALRDIALTAPPTQVRKEFDAELYDHFRHEFLRLSGQLSTMAQEENLEGAAYVHQNLTSACIACHEHVRDSMLP